MNNRMNSTDLANLLEKIAKELRDTEPHSYWDCWLMILQEMNRGNSKWSKDPIGKCSFDMVQNELQRLYAIDKTVRELGSGS